VAAERTTDAVEIYTDGACRGNPGPGGWAALLRRGTHEREIHGAEPHTTNNRMELTAVIRALEALRRPADVRVYTDSEYVRRGVTEWLTAWKARGWRTADKKPVKNQDLWERLDELIAPHRIAWHWVKGHSGVEGNERVDQLANEAIDALEQSGLR
jgi:ribonuclease HI